MKSFLALSLGSSCGWARLDVSDRGGMIWAHGSWNCRGAPSARLDTFRFYSDQQLALGVDRIFVHGRAGSMLAALNDTCIMRGIVCEPVSIVRVRLFATGSGRAGVITLIKAARSWGFEPTSAGAARAIACLMWAWEEAA